MAPQRRICCCPPLGANAGVNDRSFEGKRRARSRPLRAKSRSRAVSAPMPSRKLTHPPARSWRSMTPNALSAKRWPPATPGETCSRVREKKSRFSGPYPPLLAKLESTTLTGSRFVKPAKGLTLMLGLTPRHSCHPISHTGRGASVRETSGRFACNRTCVCVRLATD